MSDDVWFDALEDIDSQNSGEAISIASGWDAGIAETPDAESNENTEQSGVATPLGVFHVDGHGHDDVEFMDVTSWGAELGDLSIPAGGSDLDLDGHGSDVPSGEDGRDSEQVQPHMSVSYRTCCVRCPCQCFTCQII